MPAEILRMPRLGETMEEGRLVAWTKRPGETFARGEVLAEVETDKTVVELPALADGRLVRTLVDAGDDVAVDAPIAEIETAADAAPGVLSDDAAGAGEGARGGDGEGAGEGAAGARRAGAPATGAPAVPEAPSTGEPGGKVRATPLARRLARRHGLSVAAIDGTGRRGRVEAADVLRHAGIVASRPQAEAAADASSPAHPPMPAQPPASAQPPMPAQPATPAQPPAPRQANGTDEALRAIPIFGGTMAVAVHGSPDAAPLLLLHGFSGFNGSWGAIPAMLAARGRLVVVPDLPAHGDTTLPAASPEDLAAPLPDLLAALAVAPERVEIVGHSLGGAVATRLAETLVSRGMPPHRLTLLAPAGMGREIDRGFVRALASEPTAGALAHLLRSVSVRDPGLSQEALEVRAAALAGGRLKALAGVLGHRSGQGIDIVPALRRLCGRIPIRIGFGVKDAIIPWTHVARAPSDAAVHLFENAGHMIHWDAPEELLRLLASPRDEAAGNG